MSPAGPDSGSDNHGLASPAKLAAWAHERAAHHLHAGPGRSWLRAKALARLTKPVPLRSWTYDDNQRRSERVGSSSTLSQPHDATARPRSKQVPCILDLGRHTAQRAGWHGHVRVAMSSGVAEALPHGHAGGPDPVSAPRTAAMRLGGFRNSHASAMARWYKSVTPLSGFPSGRTFPWGSCIRSHSPGSGCREAPGPTAAHAPRTRRRSPWPTP
jgi:hypothetical protein